MEQYGIDKLKKSALFTVDLGVELADNLSDGKLSFGEILGLYDNVASLPDILTNAKQIKLEVEDLSLEEREELNRYIYENLPAKKRKKMKFSPYIVGEIIQRSIDAVVTIAALSLTISSLVKKG